MSRFYAFVTRVFPATPRYSDIAVGDLTDSQLRRAGLNKAEMLHRTFSGLSTCG